MIILCFYNALDFQLEIIFSFIIVEKIKKFCFLTNHEERLRKKFYFSNEWAFWVQFQKVSEHFAYAENQNKELEK